MVNIGQLISGKIERLAFGGEGILRYNGMVVFIPFAAVGDELEAVVTQSKKSFARATIKRMLNPSDERIKPRCEYFGVCGGCQLQHLAPEQQLVVKQEWVRDALTRIGRLKNVDVMPAIAAEQLWEYRRTVKLRFDSRFKLGYVNASSSDSLAVKSCPIFRDDAALFDDLNAFIENCFKGTAVEDGIMTLCKASAAKFVALIDVKSEISTLPALPTRLQGCVIQCGTSRRQIGDITLEFEQHGFSFRYTPFTFVQNHPEQSAKLSAKLIEAIIESGARSVFDLYCGFGVSAIALARQSVEVIAVEGNAEAIEMAQVNAKTNHTKVEWVCDDVARFIGPGLKRRKPDAVIVNPPRTGLAPSVTKALATSNVPVIAYVSCMPQTLARDLAVLCDAGYAIASCQSYEMFPQTTHVETLVVLKRNFNG